MKPSFFHDVDLLDLSPLHRLLFIGLWCYADREGRLADYPKQIKHDILPREQCDVDEMLEDMATIGLLVRYATESDKIIQICNFEKHQNPHPKEVPSVLPQMPFNSTASRENKSLARLSPFPSVTLPLSPVTDNPDDPPIDFESAMHAWNRHRGFKKPNKQVRDHYREQWKHDITAAEFDACLDGFFESDWAKEQSYPFAALFKDPRKWKVAWRPDLSDTPEALPAQLAPTEATTTPQTLKRDFLAEWNDAVPAAATEFDGGPRSSQNLLWAKSDPDFVEKFTEICRRADQARQNHPDATWMDFYWILSCKEGSHKRNWKRLFGDLEWMTRSKAAAEPPKKDPYSIMQAEIARRKAAEATKEAAL